MGKQTKEDLIKESMSAPKRIDSSINFKIPRHDTPFDAKKNKFKCSCCGKGFNSQKANFQKSSSPLFQANDGFLPWCKDCTDKYVSILTAFYSNNEEHAIEHFCQQADWVYDIEPLKCAREISSDRSRISHYAAKKNLNVDGRKTYFDSIVFDYENNQVNVIKSIEQVKSGGSTIPATAVDRWGIGLNEWDYNILEDHYKMLRRNNPNADNNQEIFIKSLCSLNWVTQKMLRSDNIDASKYTSLIEQYNKTFTKAGLRTVEEKDSSNDETFCMTLGFISEHTPEEFYLNKHLYEDMDKFGEYLERHVTRPMINLETGSETRDYEYFVPDEEDDYDE